MFLRLLILLTVVPFVELMILLRLAEWLRWDGTIALVLATGVLGAWLARREGLKVLTRVQEDLNAGRMPAEALVDGLLILVAGIVLVTPGVLTDACGFLMLIPPIRRFVARRLIQSFKDRMVITHRRDESGAFVDVSGTSRDADDRGDHNLC